MKGNPARPRGPLTSKPTWSNTSGYSTTSVFFAFGDVSPSPGRSPLNQSRMTVAQQLAEAASVFEHRRTGHRPKSVTVVLSEDTLVITLHGALSLAEKALAQ